MQDVDRDPLEYANWRDTGCDLHPSCLECPLPRCIEEQFRGRQRQKMEERAVAMQGLASAGSTVREIAAAYYVSERTVQRELHRKVALKKKAGSVEGLQALQTKNKPLPLRERWKEC